MVASWRDFYIKHYIQKGSQFGTIFALFWSSWTFQAPLGIFMHLYVLLFAHFWRKRGVCKTYDYALFRLFCQWLLCTHYFGFPDNKSRVVVKRTSPTVEGHIYKCVCGQPCLFVLQWCFKPRKWSWASIFNEKQSPGEKTGPKIIVRYPWDNHEITVR